MDDDCREHKGNSSPSSLKEMLKSTLCLSGCLRKHRNDHHHHHPLRQISISSDGDDARTAGRLTRSSSAKEKSRSQRESPDAKSTDHRRSHFISRLSRNGRRHSSASADFHYDPLSYSRNFDEGYDEGHVDDPFPLRNFSSRLPASPPKASPSNTPREMIIAAYS